jgi:hypothetical protein
MMNTFAAEMGRESGERTVPRTTREPPCANTAVAVVAQEIELNASRQAIT